MTQRVVHWLIFSVAMALMPIAFNGLSIITRGGHVGGDARVGLPRGPGQSPERVGARELRVERKRARGERDDGPALVPRVSVVRLAQENERVRAPAPLALARLSDRPGRDRIERESLAFHRRVRGAYRRLAADEPRRIRLIDATRPADSVFDVLRDDLDRLIARLAR